MNPEVTPPPQPNVTPQPTMPTPAPVAPAPAPAQPQPIIPASGSGSPKKGLMIGLIVGAVVLLLVILGLVYFLFFSAAAVTKRVSNKYMQAITTGDVAGALELVNTVDEAGAKTFLETAATSSEGTYKLTDSAIKDGKAYYLYDLSNEAGKMGRTTIEKANGKWKVSSYVYGADNLALIPGDTTATTTNTSTTTTTSTKTCLAKDDFNQLWKDKFGASAGNAEVDMSKSGSTDNVHFKPRSTEFTDTSNVGNIAAYAKFAKTYQDKDFTLQYRASVGSLNADDLALAEQRAEKIHGMLVKAGAPESLLKKLDSVTQEATGGSSNSVADGRDRAVAFGIVPSTACGHPTGSL